MCYALFCRKSGSIEVTFNNYRLDCKIKIAHQVIECVHDHIYLRQKIIDGELVTEWHPRDDRIKPCRQLLEGEIRSYILLGRVKTRGDRPLS